MSNRESICLQSGLSICRLCTPFWSWYRHCLALKFRPKKDGKNPQKLTAENPGTIPVLNKVTSGGGSPTHPLSGIGRHVNASLKKIGAKNIDAGLGHGVGFGTGLAMKPGVVHQFQLYLVQSVAKMMTKVGVYQNFGQPILSKSVLSRTSTMIQNPPFPKVNMMQYMGAENPIHRILGNNKNVSKGLSDEGIQSQGDVVVAKPSLSNHTEKVIRRFLQDPALQGNSLPNEIDDGQMKSENRMLHLVLKHELIIEELLEENEKLRRILVEDLKISPHRFHSKHSTNSTSSCSDCSEHQKKQKRR